MTDRRRQARAVFLAPADAHVEIVSDAAIESRHRDRLVAISVQAASIGEHFVIETSSPGGLQSWEATVIRCERIISESPLRHRLTLSLIPLTPRTSGAPVIVM